MSDQLALFEMPQDFYPTGNNRLFFALVAGSPVSECFTKIAHQLRFNHGLVGRPLAPDRFHVSLAHLGDFKVVPGDFVEAAGAAAAAVAAKLAPFKIQFDFAESFPSKTGRRPLVLQQDQEDPNLKNLHHQLLVALGLLPKGKTAKFTPHVTLLYDESGVTKMPIDPILWTVSEIVLVHSFVGQSRYEFPGRWPLKS